MSTKKSKGDRDAALSKLVEEKKKLQKSRRTTLSELKRIERKLTQIQADYGHIFNAPSPLLSLPTEVTCMIFDYAAAHHNVFEPKTWKQSLLPEVVISHVCKQWREVSLGYPRLWTKFFHKGDAIGFTQVPIERFAAYIKRSGSQNLELYLELREIQESPQGLGEKTGFYRMEMLEMAMKEVARWKIVTLQSEFGTHFESDLAALDLASAPNLEYFSVCLDLALSSDKLPETIENLSPTFFQGGAPKLSYLMLDGSTNIIPPMSNITTLRIEAGDCMPDVLYNWSTFLEILSIPSLTNLSLVGNAFQPPENDGVHLITMNNLKHLRYSDNECMTLLLPHLRTARLETLSIRNDWIPEEFGNSLGNEPSGLYFFPSLRSLTLIESTPSSSDSAWLLMQMTRNASSILISHDDSDENFLTALHAYGHSPFNSECWPKLNSLTLDLTSLDNIQVLSDFISSRPKDTLTLRVFNETDYAWKIEFPDEYQEMKKSCSVEVLDPEDPGTNRLIQPFWPPGGTYPDYACRQDPFAIESYNM